MIKYIKGIALRRWVQLATLIVSNAYIFSYFKNLPCGFLNCSRCAFATVKCPLIAFQTGAMVMGMYGALAPKTVALLTATSASLFLFASTLGTWTCSWLCPFGTIQDYFHKVPVKKFKLPDWMAWGRIPIFIFLGVVMAYQTKSLFFCNICPPGTIARLAQDATGIPQFLRGPEGMMAFSGMVIMITILLLSTFISRPFCHLFCPIGGFYGIFNKASGLFRKVKAEECNQCSKCKRSCPQGLDPFKSLNSQTCNRCLECHKTCKALVCDVRI
nr:4Fe-4S binding protein [Desulfobulbaceae bacterium]